jgi:hypothetical protein
MKRRILELLAEGGQPHNGVILHEDGEYKVITREWHRMKLNKLQRIIEKAQQEIEENGNRYQVLARADKKAQEIGYTIDFGLSGEIDGIIETNPQPKKVNDLSTNELEELDSMMSDIMHTIDKYCHVPMTRNTRAILETVKMQKEAVNKALKARDEQ